MAPSSQLRLEDGVADAADDGEHGRNHSGTRLTCGLDEGVGPWCCPLTVLTYPRTVHRYIASVKQEAQSDHLPNLPRRRTPIWARATTLILISVPIWISYDFFSSARPGSDYYSTVAQVIAAMYLAVALESFTSGGVTLGRFDQVEFAVLLMISWIGLIACLRGIVVVSEEAWTAGLGGSGLIAATLLVTSNLANRVSIRNPRLVALVGYIACLAPLVVFIPPH